MYSYEHIDKHLKDECPKMKMRCKTCHGPMFPLDEKIPYKPDKKFPCSNPKHDF